MRWLDGITNLMDMSFSISGRCWRTGSLESCSPWGRKEQRHDWATERKQMKDMHMLGEGVEQSLPWRWQWSDGLEPQDQKKPLPPLLLRLATCPTFHSYEVPVAEWGSQLSCQCIRGSLMHWWFQNLSLTSSSSGGGISHRDLDLGFDDSGSPLLCTVTWKFRSGAGMHTCVVWGGKMSTIRVLQAGPQPWLQ